jgi:hypothetical protein
MAELAVAVETVTLTAAPGADEHTLSYRLATFNAPENYRQNPVVPLYESTPPHLTPVKFSHPG